MFLHKQMLFEDTWDEIYNVGTSMLLFYNVCMCVYLCFCIIVLLRVLSYLKPQKEFLVVLRNNSGYYGNKNKLTPKNGVPTFHIEFE